MASKKDVEINLAIMSTSLNKIAEICEKIEAGDGQFSLDMLPRFDISKENLARSVDITCSMLEIVSAQTKFLKNKVAVAQGKIKQLEEIEENLKDSTLNLMREHKNITFSGNEYEMRTQKNSATPLIWHIEFQKLDHIIDPLDSMKFPDAYMKKVVVFILDKKRLSADVLSGKVECDGVKVGERGEHLRFT